MTNGLVNLGKAIKLNSALNKIYIKLHLARIDMQLRESYKIRPDIEIDIKLHLIRIKTQLRESYETKLGM